MKKIFALILAGAILLAACVPAQATTTAAPATDDVPLVIQTPLPQAETLTPEIQSSTPAATFLLPLEIDCVSHNIASSDAVVYPIGEDGVVYVTEMRKARAGTRLESNIQYLIYEGLKESQSLYSIVTFKEPTNEFRFDGGGIAVLGDYYPGQLLSEWYETANTSLVQEIKGLMDLIKANAILLAPASDQSIAFTCPSTP